MYGRLRYRYPTTDQKPERQNFLMSPSPGFIGDDKSKCDWLKNLTELWERNVHTIRKTAGKCTEESYTTVVSAIQLEWIFLQRITKNMGDVFAGMEKMLQESFLSYLFFVNSKSLSPIVGTISMIPVRKASMGLLNAVASASEKCLSLQRAIIELI